MSNPFVDKLRELDTHLKGTVPPVFDTQLEHLFEIVPAAVMFLDINGKIIRANKRAIEMLGQKVEGKSAKDLFRDHERRQVLDAQVIQTGIPRRHELHEHRRADGTRVWLLTDRIPHHNIAGKVDGVLLFSVDVTGVVDRT